MIYRGIYGYFIFRVIFGSVPFYGQVNKEEEEEEEEHNQVNEKKVLTLLKPTNKH